MSEPIGILRFMRNELFSGYTQHTHEDRPLGAYATLIAGFWALTGGEVWLAMRRGRGLPERLAWSDVALLGLATHKISRLITRDTVTSVLRAPFATFEGSAGQGEVNESARGTGLQHALGELITCPFCFGQWVLAVLGFGLIAWPRQTRFVAGLCASLSLADLLHMLYGILRKHAD